MHCWWWFVTERQCKQMRFQSVRFRNWVQHRDLLPHQKMRGSFTVRFGDLKSTHRHTCACSTISKIQQKTVNFWRSLAIPLGNTSTVATNVPASKNKQSRQYSRVFSQSEEPHVVHDVEQQTTPGPDEHRVVHAAMLWVCAGSRERSAARGATLTMSIWSRRRAF